MKKIDTAVDSAVTLESGVKIVVQEMSFMGTLKAIRIINRVVKNAKKAGSLDSVLKSFREMGEDGEGSNIDKLLDAVDILFSAIGDEPELLPRLVSYTCVGDWDENSIGELPFGDVVELIKAGYRVNWVEGSLKNALSRAGIVKDDSKTSPKKLKKASAKPVAEKT